MTPSPSPSATSSPSSSRPTSSPTTTTFDSSSRPSFAPLTLPPVPQVGTQSQNAPQPQQHGSLNTHSRSPSVPAPSSSSQGRLRHGKYRSDDSITAELSDNSTMNPVKMEEERTGQSEGDGEGDKSKPVVKKKRTRTLTTPHQSAVLHALLAQSRFPTTAMREEVGRSIGLSARKVQVWFQNQRQKQRKPRNQASGSGGTTTPTDAKRPVQFGSFSGAPQPETGPEPGPSGTSGLSRGHEHSGRTSGHLPDMGPSLLPPRGMPAPMHQAYQHPPETYLSQYGDVARPYSSGMSPVSPVGGSGPAFFSAPLTAPPYYPARSSPPFPTDPYSSHPSPPRNEPPIQLPPLRIDTPTPQRPPSSSLRPSTSIPSLAGLEISSPTASSSSRPVLPPPITLQPMPQFDLDRRLPPSFWGPPSRARTTSDPSLPPDARREGLSLLTQPWPLPGVVGQLPPPPGVIGRYETAELSSLRGLPEQMTEDLGPHRGSSRAASYHLGRPVGGEWPADLRESVFRTTTRSPSPSVEISRDPSR